MYSYVAHVYTSLWSYLRSELLGYTLTLCPSFWQTFHSNCVPFKAYKLLMRVSPSFQPGQHRLLLVSQQLRAFWEQSEFWLAGNWVHESPYWPFAGLCYNAVQIPCSFVFSLLMSYRNLTYSGYLTFIKYTYLKILFPQPPKIINLWSSWGQKFFLLHIENQRSL